MASLSVSRKTSLVAGALGTLPRFGETTCAQDAVVARTSSINVHSVLISKALPLEGRALSERSCIAIGFSLYGIFNFVLCIVSLFRESQSSVPAGCSCGCVIKLGNPSDLHSAPREYLCVHCSIAAPGSRPRLQFRGTRPARVRNRRARRVVFLAAPMRSGQGGRAPQ